LRIKEIKKIKENNMGMSESIYLQQIVSNLEKINTKLKKLETIDEDIKSIKNNLRIEKSTKNKE
jgi:hypothetical protein